MIAIIIALAISTIAAISDLRTKTIPNWLSYGGMALGPVLHVVIAFAHGARGDALGVAATDSFLGAGLCGLLPMFAVLRGKLGTGDLKLFLALGSVLGPLVGFEAEIYAIVVAFVAAPLFAWRAGRLGSALAYALASLRNAVRSKKAKKPLPEHETSWMPLAPAILAGVVLAAVGSWR